VSGSRPPTTYAQIHKKTAAESLSRAIAGHYQEAEPADARAFTYAQEARALAG